ncbi:Rid family detoxifying hydrolase [Liquorilactobacillus mali]|uniref:Rid family detoxifying hydrolase n=1 Tax=Liquorilactobacillus mali TaxID=1618 RepID=UPI00295451BE|nr:Rid family detoxifying hydrolase [Liquorilactobacillus mali]MDV7758179.1 hypothetical protein [Liquorilactobacillus mali]
MKKEIISTQNAPKAVGPYSQAIKVGNFLFCSGQIGIDPQNNKLVNGGITAETKQVFKNIESVLIASNFATKNIAKVNIYMADVKAFQIVNEMYSSFFKKIDKLPARSAVGIKELPLGASIEIEIIAIKCDNNS